MEIIHELLKRNNAQIFEFKDLPIIAQNSLNHYFLDECDNPPFNPHELYYFSEIDTQDLINTHLSISEDWNNWEVYHKEYMSVGGVPVYIDTWAVILYPENMSTEDNYEILLDGWHRFHSYVEKGLSKIPAVMYCDKS